MTGKYSIYPLHLGDLVRQKSNIAYMREPGMKITFPVIAFYLTDGNSKILVDNGGSAPDHRYQPYTRTPDQEPSVVLRRLGVEPSGITDVILTHLHWDHAGNNALFPNAKFYVQRSELQYAVAPLVIHQTSYDYDLVFKTKYEVLDAEEEILPGISVITTPGHSPGSQSVIVDTIAGRYLIAGDLIGLYECYESNPMIVNGIHTDLIAYYKSLAKVKACNCILLPGHDPLVLQHAVYPDKV